MIYEIGFSDGVIKIKTDRPLPESFEGCWFVSILETKNPVLINLALVQYIEVVTE